MTKEEFATLTMALRTYYPKENILPNTPAMELWYRELQDIPYTVAETALRKWVSTNKWSPSIAEIRETVAQISNGATQDWGEAWEKVLKAVSRYGLYAQGEAMRSLDPLTRKAVERLGFRDVCLSENIATERANFRMIYETLAKREQTEQQMALPLREAISMIQLKGMNGEVLKLGE